MFCRNCGKEVVAGAQFCPTCGARPVSGWAFCNACGAATTPLTERCPKCGTGLLPASRSAAPVMPAAAVRSPDVSPQSRLVVTLLAYFLGYFGAHRFYLGQIGTGLAMLFTFGGLGIWYIVDFIFAVCGMMKDKDGKLIVDWQV